MVTLRHSKPCSWVAASSLLFCLYMASAHGAGAVAATDDPSRPRIGLVLAGGGAKGGAHVGVLKVLEVMHVPSE